MESQPLQVEIISKTLIKPSSPTPQHLQNYQLSFFDQLAEKEHMPLLLFYPRCTSNSIIDEKFDEKLEQSLSKVLTHTYPAAGRLSKDGYSIDCLDQGVTFIKAKDNSFGNYVIDAPILFVPGDTKMELHDFVTLIRNSVQKTVDVCTKGSTDDIVLGVANSYKENFLSPKWGGNDEVDKCIISSLCKFPMQDADFGLGKPSLMHFGLRDYHSCWMYDTECGTGICVQVDLKDTYMHVFECDHDIKAFSKFN